MGVFIPGNCCSVCLLSCFDFNRGRKAFQDPLGLLARKDTQVRKACLDHRDPRYGSLWVQKIPSPLNLLYADPRAAENLERIPHRSQLMDALVISCSSLSWALRTESYSKMIQMIIIIFKLPAPPPPPPWATVSLPASAPPFFHPTWKDEFFLPSIQDLSLYRYPGHWDSY